jgi:uncharacterized protein (DUF488 family)
MSSDIIDMMASSDKSNCFTIGHSDLEQEEFIDLLVLHNVDLLVDVRAFPYINYLPQFDRDRLDSVLHRIGINYIWMGLTLGCLTRDGRIDSIRREREESFQEGMTQLMDLLHDNRLCLMSSESDWRISHRHTLIAQTLMRYGISVWHIDRDGTIVEAVPDLFHTEERTC